MDRHLLWAARVTGLAGVLLCAAAIIARLAGNYAIGPFQVGTVLIGGMAATLLACLAYLVILAEARRL